MKNDILYLWGKEDLQVILGNRIAPRIKIILGGEFLITIAMATVFLLRAFQIESIWIAWLLGLGAGSLYVLASYRFLSRFFFRERLKINTTHFTIIKQSLFYKKSFSYDWRCMGTLHYIGKDMPNNICDKYTCYDYLDFGRRDTFANDLHENGNLFFIYKEETVRFAKGIYSWHAQRQQPQARQRVAIFDGNIRMGCGISREKL